MNRIAGGLLFIASAALAAEPPNPVSGFVAAHSATSLQLRDGRQTLHFEINSATLTSRRGKLEPGERVRVRWTLANGKYTALAVSTWTDFAGVIDRKHDDSLEVRNLKTNEVREIRLTAATQSGVLRRHIEVGTEIRAGGWDLGDGRIEAVHIAVFNTDLPSDRL